MRYENKICKWFPGFFQVSRLGILYVQLMLSYFLLTLVFMTKLHIDSFGPFFVLSTIQCLSLNLWIRHKSPLLRIPKINAFCLECHFNLKKSWFEVGQSKFKHPVCLQICKYSFSEWYVIRKSDSGQQTTQANGILGKWRQ